MRDVKLLIEFLREKHDQTNPEGIKAEELNEYLWEFILYSMKRKDGKDFEASSLRDMLSSFNRHLKECHAVSLVYSIQLSILNTISSLDLTYKALFCKLELFRKLSKLHGYL